MRRYNGWLFLAFSALACAGPAAEGEDRAGSDDLRAGHAREAYAHFAKAVAAEPLDDRAYRHLVEAARAVGELDGLTLRARSYSESHRADARGHYRLGLCLFAHTSGEREGLGELAEAVRLAPDEAEFQLRWGAALLEAEHPTEAVGPLQAAVALAPADPHPRLPLALALHRSGRDPEAIAQMAAALPLGPSAEDLKAFRHLRDRLGERSRALPASIRPRFEDALSALGQADSPARAIDLLEALAAEQPILAPLQTALGLAYLRAGDNAQAVAHLRRAIELDPLPAEPYLYLGQVYRSLRRDTEAREALRLATTRDPLLDAAHDQLAQTALQAGDAEEAAREARVLVSLRQGDPGTRLLLAQALTQAGDLPGAETELHTLAAAPTDKPGTNERLLEPLLAAGTQLQAQLELGGLELTLAQRTRDPTERGHRYLQARLWLDKVLKAQPDNLPAKKLEEQIPR